MKRCGEYGLFCSCGALWPSGMCLPCGDRLISAGRAACVCWEEDMRGVDQSDGERGKCESSLLRECMRDEAEGESEERGNQQSVIGSRLRVEGANAERPTSAAERGRGRAEGGCGDGGPGAGEPGGVKPGARIRQLRLF